ncbi:uncharacterized protein LOC123011641 [Tribolium madens]|uniref:uncharacterized protein LOC123011641 n=1 Tax=Tribolium madens TaxID=41895 RepID=UPI001CF72D14|nr:uncharacterized protein LOC123011641 [Tribolium madens]
MPGYKINECNISCLAFADDLILTANSPNDAQKLLQVVETFLRDHGMKLSLQKCVSFQVEPTRDSFYVQDANIFANNREPIPNADAESKIRYLGMDISPWCGIDIKQMRGEVRSMLKWVKCLALKLHQKIELLSGYLVPHYLFRILHGGAPTSTIRGLDDDFRVAVKEILYLPLSTVDGMIYTRKRDGGLGFPRLEVTAIASSHKSGMRFLESPDPAIRALAAGTGLRERLRRQACVNRINWPILDTKTIDRWKIEAKRQELRSWGASKTQGKAAKSLADDPISNCWLYNPTLLKPCRYLMALKIRSNTCVNKVALNRAVLQHDLTKTVNVVCCPRR